jgi:hypothetical protein
VIEGISDSKRKMEWGEAREKAGGSFDIKPKKETSTMGILAAVN